MAAMKLRTPSTHYSTATAASYASVPLRAARMAEDALLFLSLRATLASALSCSPSAASERRSRNTRSTGPLVDRRKVDRLLQPHQNSKGPVELWDSCVRDGDTLAHAGRAKLLAFEDFSSDQVGIQPQLPLQRAARALAGAVPCLWRVCRQLHRPARESL